MLLPEPLSNTLVPLYTSSSNSRVRVLFLKRRDNATLYTAGLEGKVEEGARVAEVTYISRVKVEPVEGKIRRAQLPAKEEPVYFGVHSEVAEHYGVSPDVEDPYPSTLDYLVAAAGG